MLISINNTTTDKKAILDALKGDYGTTTINGLVVRKQGGLLYMQGEFSAGTEVVEIPNIPCRVAMMFTNDTTTACSLAEPNQSFVKVPSSINGRFVCFATCILNY